MAESPSTQTTWLGCGPSGRTRTDTENLPTPLTEAISHPAMAAAATPIADPSRRFTRNCRQPPKALMGAVAFAGGLFTTLKVMQAGEW